MTDQLEILAGGRIGLINAIRIATPGTPCPAALPTAAPKRTKADLKTAAWQRFAEFVKSSESPADIQRAAQRLLSHHVWSEPERVRITKLRDARVAMLAARRP